ncbi:LysE family translocator [Actinokineospora xionganensis]|uniref:LysE family translocator n=1 Tax=Actinokineospora xionganensis TaxID=2684470 RepID=A0ABR7L4J9_9PSEU|nr:LysE family translocator [Actinokineospora xionganensis]MBC6447613.1 LysE family translocator [Actinokineospora xionganensis]
MSVEFWLTTFIIVITPGTGVVYTMAAGLARGSRASVVAALGSTVGIVPHMLAAITGLAALLHTSALAFQILKYLGVAYLLYMAISTFRDRSALTVTEETGPLSVRKVITSAIVLNLLNPKLTIFFFAFLPQFVTAGEPNAFLRMIAMSGVFMAMTFVVFTAYGLFAAAIRTHVISRPKILAWMRRTFAGAFLVLGAKLAFTDK